MSTFANLQEEQAVIIRKFLERSAEAERCKLKIEVPDDEPDRIELVRYKESGVAFQAPDRIVIAIGTLSELELVIQGYAAGVRL